jgi:predicted nucleic-acid-binding Zn-ribbon protein
MNKCPKCGSSHIDDGDLRGLEEPENISYYHSRNKKFLKGMAGVRAFVCKDCGYTELYTDTHQLKKSI